MSLLWTGSATWLSQCGECPARKPETSQLQPTNRQVATHSNTATRAPLNPSRQATYQQLVYTIRGVFVDLLAIQWRCLMMMMISFWLMMVHHVDDIIWVDDGSSCWLNDGW